jgi:hypothetical protein
MSHGSRECAPDDNPPASGIFIFPSTPRVSRRYLLSTQVNIPGGSLVLRWARISGPRGLRRGCHAKEILWTTKESNIPSFNCLTAVVGDMKSDLAIASPKSVSLR